MNTEMQQKIMLLGSVEAVERLEHLNANQKSLLPKKLGSIWENVKFVYNALGIEIVDNGDPLFFSATLPEGWKIVKVDGDHYWSNVYDNLGRERLSIFFKSLFYDRDAFAQLSPRYKINVIKNLPNEKRGKFKMMPITTCVKPEFYEERMYQNGEFVKLYEPRQMKTQLEKVWVDKYKTIYDEINNTPFYFEVYVEGKLAYSTVNMPVRYKIEYTQETHNEWWNEYDNILQDLHNEATFWLDEKHPNWMDRDGNLKWSETK